MIIYYSMSEFIYQYSRCIMETIYINVPVTSVDSFLATPLYDFAQMCYISVFGQSNVHLGYDS